MSHWKFRIGEEVAESLLTQAPDLIKTVNETALKKLEIYVDKNSHYFYEVSQYKLDVHITCVNV
jgi:hypothetical protein